MTYYDPRQRMSWPPGNPFFMPPVWNPWLQYQQPYHMGAGNQPFVPGRVNPTSGFGAAASPSGLGTGNRPSAPGASGAATQAKQLERAGKKELKPEQFTAKNLGQEDLDKIISRYGLEIDDIYHLSPGQKWMFRSGQKVTSAFFLQMVLKVTMDLKPASFRQKIDEVSIKRSNLRSAYVYEGLKEPCQVILRNRRPELRYIDRRDKTMEELQEELEEYCMADRRRGFDLENDPLLRIAVFCTAEENTYAIVSSQPHINDDGASEMVVFKEIYIDYVLGDKIKLPEIVSGSYKNYAKWLEGLDRESEAKYWEKLFSDAPDTRLPGRVRTSPETDMNTLVLTFSEEEDGLISKLQARYGATLNSIVQTAWAVMLQKIYNTRDVVFGTITSGRSAEVKDSSQITGGFTNAFPVRVQTEAGELFLTLVKRVQLQILQSQEKAHFSPEELEERLGRDTAIFDHLVNFHNFSGASPQKLPAFPGFTILDMDFYDNLSTGFCLYFQMKEGKLQCLFTYDSHMFTERKIRQLMNCYQQVLGQVLRDTEKDLLVEQIQCPDISSFLSAEREYLEEQGYIQSFLKGLPLFEGVSSADISVLAREAAVRHYVENDLLLREGGIAKGLDIVLDGFVESFRTAKNGWDSSLLILGPGKLLTAAGVLENVPSYMGARVASGEATILHISKASCLRLINSHPSVALHLVREQEELARRFSFVWINADI